MALGQDLALDELLRMTSLEREARGVRLGKQLKPTDSAAGIEAVPPSSEFAMVTGQNGEGERAPAKAGKYRSS